ncbi:hypothetical protein [Kineococcus sp. SYSU DK018]|uniref:hypothetical protein n=1 Tax=Kineococcus sp. SYSU DK018 TaxID=3383139 RepID=UPI003D7EC450
MSTPDERPQRRDRIRDAVQDEVQDRARDEARDEAAAEWAEREMTLRPHSPTALHGTAAAAHGRAALEAALGGAEAVEQVVRGRKTLGQHRPAGRSPKRQATLPAELDQRGLDFIAAGGAPDYSTLMRQALTEYLERHSSQPA